MPAILRSNDSKNPLIRRQLFQQAMENLRDKHERRISESVKYIMEEVIGDLVRLTPRYTGAGAGKATGTPMLPSHPGYGMTIGNNPGDTGWQLYKAHQYRHVAIVNPMWEPYLKYRNYMGTIGSNFVETAAANFRRKLREMRG